MRLSARLQGMGARIAYAILPRLGYDVARLAPGAVLVTRPAVARRSWMQMDKQLAKKLTATHVSGLLEMYGVNCVLDVGGNKGQYGLMLRKAGYRGHIVSFEPVPTPFAKLAAEAKDDPRWSVHQIALGKEDGTTTINAVPGSLSSMLPPTRFGAGRYPRLQEARSIDVELRRLGPLLRDVLPDLDGPPRLFLKLDTQGFDLEVFAGLGDAVRDIVGMQSEVALLQIYEGMPRMCQALETYEAAGFEVSALYPVSRQRRTARVLEFDCVMVRAETLKGKRVRLR